MNSLWFILIVAGFSFLQWLFKVLAAQAEKRRFQHAQQRAELEMLRTGKSVESSDEPEARPSPARDNEDRRRQELAELRRRAAARRTPQPQSQTQAQTQTPKSTRPPAPNPLEILLGLPPGTTTGGTISPSPARTLPPSQPRPVSSRTDSEAKKRRLAQQRIRAQQLAAEAKRNQERLEQQARAARAAASAATVEQRLLRAAQPVPASPAISHSFGMVPRSARDWRRAIVMNEILSKPVSIR
ncbi:MAG: hypothetical protein KF691_02520 [Phycisphaeraceae bacterium]|nr:hypothetical protein [Phycisphaeraceae bacterium]